MELDLKMSGMLAEMITTRTCSIDSCVAPFGVPTRPATFAAADRVRSDHIELTPETTKDSAVGRATRGQGE